VSSSRSSSGYIRSSTSWALDVVDDLDEAQRVADLADEHQQRTDVEHQQRRHDPHGEVGDVLGVAGRGDAVEHEEGVDDAEQQQAEDVLDPGVAPHLAHDPRRHGGAAEGESGEYDRDDEAHDRDQPGRECGEQRLCRADAELCGHGVLDRPVEPRQHHSEDTGRQ
jgi:hypothetical protein